MCVEYDYPDQSRLRTIPLVRRALPALPGLMLTEYHSEALAVCPKRHPTKTPVPLFSGLARRQDS